MAKCSVLSFVFTLILFCSTTHGAAHIYNCYHGSLPSGHAGPNPTQVLDIYSFQYWVNYQLLAGQMCTASGAPGICGANTQTFSNQASSIYLGLNDFNWKLNYFADYYKASWTAFEFLLVKGPVGSVSVYVGTGTCETTAYKYVNAYFGV